MSTDPSSVSPASALQQALQELRGVTPTRLEQLRRLGLETVEDLLFHFPRAYEDLTNLRPIAALSPEILQTVQGEVVEIEGRRLPDGRTVVGVVLTDDQRHCVEGVWFNQPFAARRFRYGQRVAFSGRPKWYRDHWQIASPHVQLLDAGGEQAPGIVPVYSLTEDLRLEHLRPLIGQALQRCAGLPLEILPPELRERHHLPAAPQALHDVHFPSSLQAAELARKRFIYEEFLVLQLALAVRRREVRDREKAPRLPVTPRIDQRIRRLFPFVLTADQERAVGEVCRDLSSERPMQRLLQADVGAGKTAVAVYALLVTVANRYQAVLMAPTEVLAQQHWRTLEGYLAQSRVRRLLLTGALSARARRAALAAIQQGEVDLVVGTQALIQEGVQFAKLGLVVIDEQHKFGVNQRARVRRLGVDPHYLVMTATPIPRTMALTVFGDLDISEMHQLPPGRQPVVTRWVSAAQRERVYLRVVEDLRRGRQAYVVCPLVAESSTHDLKAAEQTFHDLQAGPFREFRLGLLHGRLDDAAKADVMAQFRGRQLDVLVCTTVVEVGVDVANATLMIVEEADRFGLSQLHQLRGRVSRGTVAGQCFLLADPAGDEARERLRALVRLRDGFKLADEDARLRGAGQFFGTRQHGLGELRLGDPLRDAALLQLARKDAFALVAADAGLRLPEHAALRQVVLARFGKTLELAEVG